MKTDKCTHDPYWIGNYGTCMVCRAEKAEAELATLKQQLEKAESLPIELAAKLDDAQQQLAEAREERGNTLSALGEHPESEIDISARIRQLRDEGRAHFHDSTKLRKELSEARTKLQQAEALCQRFIDKVHFGLARSKETYAQCCDFLGIKPLE